MAKITDAYEAEMVDSTSTKKPASPLRRKKNKESQHTAEIIDITDVTEINDGAEHFTAPSKNKSEPEEKKHSSHSEEIVDADPIPCSDAEEENEACTNNSV